MAKPDPTTVPLSRREQEIMSLVAKGLSNDEIAVKLSLAGKTAKNHVSTCMKKLGARNRTEAAVTYLRLLAHARAK